MAMAFDDDDVEHRRWLHARREPPTHHERFLMLSYNILADANARSHYAGLRYHIPGLITNWNERKSKLLHELHTVSPDVICLQEVDHYHEFAEDLAKTGYTGVYKRRTGAYRDGCAMLWRESRFALLEEQSIEFREHFNLRDNVAQICVLESKCSGDGLGFKNRVVVGNVHVIHNPACGEVKLGQARVFLENLHVMSTKWGNAPVAIAGDFNCTPGSPMYWFLSSSYLGFTCYDRHRISGQNDEPYYVRKRSDSPPRVPHTMAGKRGSPPNGWGKLFLKAATGEKYLYALDHKLKLRSAYTEIEGSTKRSRDVLGEPFVTSFHGFFSYTVDYIWHTDDLSVVRVLDTLPSSSLQRDKALSSQPWASDHLALACEFSFVPRKDAQELMR